VSCRPDWIGNRYGLSYTTFEYSNLRITKPAFTNTDISIQVSLTLTNTGQLTGSEAVQLYITLPHTSDLTHPPLQLKAFRKVKHLAAAASTNVVLELDKYAVSYWDESILRWVVEKGVYTVRVGGSSRVEALVLQGTFEVGKTFEWTGL
jgi:beta-glucosidase